MSGDVQPRKRKNDKKRRRDDEETRPTGVHAAKMGPDDIQLHIHSDHGTGGHWCAKIFFFSLLAILLGLIGLILLENRGLADLDTPLSESRFADMLEGWVDEEREAHDEHDVLVTDSHEHEDEHDEGHEDHGDHDDHDDQEGHDDQDGEHSPSQEDDDQVAESQENEDDDEVEELNKVDDNDNETDEGFDESTEQADDDDDERLHSMPKIPNLTTSVVGDVDNKFRDTNTNTHIHEVQKNSIEESDKAHDAENLDIPEAHVTVKQLEDQVDELVENYNRLARSLNRPPLEEETAPIEVKVSNIKKDENDDENDNQQDVDEDDASENQPDDDDQDDDKNDEDDDDDDEGIEDNDENDNDADEQEDTTVDVDDIRTEDDDGNDIEPSDQPEEEEDGDEEEQEPSSHTGESQTATNDTEKSPEEENPEFIEMKRRFTLVTTDEPIPLSEEDLKLHLNILEKIPPIDEIRRANEQLAENPELALTLFEQILQTHPTSSAAQYGVAKSLDHMAEVKRSNAFLKRAIEEYQKYLDLGTKLTDMEFKTAAERCINRLRFLGHHLSAVPVHEQLIERFDDDPYYRNELAVTYLLVNKLADAKYVLHTTLQRWRDDGFAAAHYGFVLKILDNNLEHAVLFLRQGIQSGANGTNDGRFYFNLGDALIRLGRRDEAYQVFEEAANKKLFLSPYQRSLYNIDRLKARPFWTLAETGYKHEFRNFEQNWEKIRDEGMNILSKDGYFTDESENLRDTGVWKQFEIFARGKRNTENCKRTPFTCKLIETFPAARFCKRGQVKFSVMHPNTHVWPHCGPTNCRLRAHLGLKLADKTSIRVATETRTWTEGKIMVFDDSFEHEVWHNGTTYRLILIIDIWHPDLTADEKKTLVPI